MIPRTPRQTSEGDLPPRLLPLTRETLDGDALETFEAVRKMHHLADDAAIPAGIGTLLRHPALYLAQVDYGAARKRTSALGPRLTEIAVMRTAWHCQSPYIWGEHVKIRERAGLTADDVARIVEGPDAPGWSAGERAIIQAADELHDDAMISDAGWAALSAEYDDRQLIELISVVGSLHEVAFLYNSLRFRLNPDNSGLSAR